MSGFNPQQLKSLSAVMDEFALGAVSEYNACSKAGAPDCDTTFEKNINKSKKGKSQARTLKGMISSYYSCVRNSDDPSACANQVRRRFQQNVNAAAPRIDASPARTALEMQASAPAKGPSAEAVIAQNNQLSKPTFVANQPQFDPSTLYKDLPTVNPIALVPLRDLVGRTQQDFVKNPFSKDPRPPVFPKLKPREGLLIPEQRIQQLNSLREKYKILGTGVGFSGRAYCQFPIEY